MTRTEYAEYERAVAAFFEREGINNLSSVQAEDQDEPSEPYFSWRSCDCCGSTLGGDREDCAGYNPTTREVCGPYSVCTDCVYYAEYGQLDDQTMLDLEDEDEDEPGDEDIYTEDHRRFTYCGKVIVRVDEDEDWQPAVGAWCLANGYFPNVWLVSDHGNTVLISVGQNGRYLNGYADDTSAQVP